MSKSVTENHFSDWRQKIDESSSNDAEFLSYFDTANSVDEAFCQGYWDFSHHILKDELIPLIGEPFDCEALEIGFGGGRLLNASSRFFGKVYGVDIHEHFEKVDEFLKKRNAGRYELLKGDGKTLPVPDNSIDFVYSFIVLQHLPTLDILKSYLHEIKRVLKPGKAACLYIGHLPFNFRWKKYEDVSTRHVDTTRENTLLLRPRTTKALLRDAKLNLIRCDRPRKKPWRTDLGAQHYVIVTA